MKSIIKAPAINPNDETIVIAKWHVAEGGKIRVGIPLVDVETTKAVSTVESEHEGWLLRRVAEGQEVAVGAELAWVFSEEAELRTAAAAPSETPRVDPVPSPALATEKPVAPRRESAPAGGVTPDFTTTRLSPAAEKAAREIGLDPAALAQEKLGLLSARRVREIFAAAAPAAAAVPDGLRREKTGFAKRAEIQALSKGAEGHVRSSLTVYFDSAALRARLAAEQGDASPLPVVLFELARVLADHPRMTAFYDDGQVAYYDAVHLGVAIDLGQGLKVVAVRDAAMLTLDDIGRRLGELTLDYMENRLAPADIDGATFTVTDLSALDVAHFEPLQNGRQAAILGIGGDSTLPHHPMSFTLAFDHRVLDGREAAIVLRELRGRLLAYAAPVAAAQPVAATASAFCDRCLLPVADYYTKFGPNGVMHHYARPDGSTGLVCHVCLNWS